MIEKRSFERKPTRGRFMAKVGLDHESKAGYIDVLNISLQGAMIRPDQTFFDNVYKNFLPGKVVIMIGQNPWNRRFAMSGTIIWIRDILGTPLYYAGNTKVVGYAIGIRIASTTSDVYLKKWIDEGAPQ